MLYVNLISVSITLHIRLAIRSLMFSLTRSLNDTDFSQQQKAKSLTSVCSMQFLTLD